MRSRDTALPQITLSEARERAAVSVEEAAVLLGVGRSTAWDAVRVGRIPTARVGRRVVVPVESLLRMLDAEPAA